MGSVAWSPIALDQMFNGGGAVIDADLVAAADAAAAADDDDDYGADDKSKQMEKGEGEKGGEKQSSKVSTTAGFARVYGCGTLVCYSSVKPSAARLVHSRARFHSFVTVWS